MVALMTRSAALMLQCPSCNSHDLDVPDLPRGDDGVECLTCRAWFTYAEIESLALTGAREDLALSFPDLPFGPV
jgi:hypothetical protein